MRKTLVVLMMMFIILTSLPYVCAADAQPGMIIDINGEVTEHTSVILNDTHYVPLRMVFEKMGARVFYRGYDCQILALSRDGDIIRHIIGTNVITMNGEQRVYANPSVLVNGGTYVPLEIVSNIFCVDGISYDNQILSIQKYFHSNDYHRLIKEVLDFSSYSNFYPERFQRYLNYHANMPGFTMQEILFRVNLGLDMPFYENIKTIEHPYELLVLVNKYNKLPANFQQFNLVNMDRRYTVQDGKQYLMEVGAYHKFIEMADAASREGLSLLALSTYRTESYQGGLYNGYVSSSGKTYADMYSARPGHSEHQTGLAIDICSVYTTFEYTNEFRWLQEHAHEYGFIMRYPKGKEWITGYGYEPWHYRYVGVDAATIIHTEDITYEEYYAKYISVNEFR